MFDPTTFITFITASVIIILALGPAQALVLTRTIHEGRKSGIITAIGLNTATFVHAIAAAIGLSAILATSALAYTIVKYLGAAYLIYLGFKAFSTRERDKSLTGTPNRNPAGSFTKAFITGILNPKVALFFMAFVPQFVDPQHGWVILQFITFGAILVILDIIYESLLVYIVAAMSNRFTQNGKFSIWRRRITGFVLIGLGVRLLLLGKL
jgi:threonine/homoserine/homoserine lactone efflux protein